MLELVLMRTFLLLCSRDPEPYHRCLYRPMSGESCSSQSDDDDRGDHIDCTNRCLECRAFTLVASVCSSWHLTLIGWPQSPTRYWFRHKLKKLIECEYSCTHSHTLLSASCSRSTMCSRTPPFVFLHNSQTADEIEERYGEIPVTARTTPRL